MTTTKIKASELTAGQIITIASEIGRVVDIIEARGRTGRRHLVVEHNEEGQTYERRYSVGARETFELHQ